MGVGQESICLTAIFAVMCTIVVIGGLAIDISSNDWSDVWIGLPALVSFIVTMLYLRDLFIIRRNKFRMKMKAKYALPSEEVSNDALGKLWTYLEKKAGGSKE